MTLLMSLKILILSISGISGLRFELRKMFEGIGLYLLSLSLVFWFYIPIIFKTLDLKCFVQVYKRYSVLNMHRPYLLTVSLKVWIKTTQMRSSHKRKWTQQSTVWRKTTISWSQMAKCFWFKFKKHFRVQSSVLNLLSLIAEMRRFNRHEIFYLKSASHGLKILHKMM